MKGPVTKSSHSLGYFWGLICSLLGRECRKSAQQTGRKREMHLDRKQECESEAHSRRAGEHDATLDLHDLSSIRFLGMVGGLQNERV